MKQTERLYGVQPSKYAELQIALCEMKLADIEVLRNKLRKKLNLLDGSQKQKDIQLRIKEVSEAKEFNQGLILEAKGLI